jgi:uncharacterized protein (DUF697 family)
MNFLSLYGKLEGLVQRLPEALQKPILHEINPIKTLFLLQHPPRLVLLGQRGGGKAEIVNALFGSAVLLPGEEDLTDGGWQNITAPNRGSLRVLDARRPVSRPMVETSLAAEAPDLYLYVRPENGTEQGLRDELSYAAEILGFADQRHSARARILGLLIPGANADTPQAARDQLHSALHSSAELSNRLLGTIALTDPERLATRIARELPGESKLEMARLSGDRELQREIAQVVIKSATAICAAVGAQPIPFADFPILTSVQATLVASIMHISGREKSPRLVGEFLAAVGANIGAGLVLREGARAAARFVPLWGSAISSAVAGAGTYAVGRAAVAYFVDGMSINDARSVFRKGRRGQPRLKE